MSAVPARLKRLLPWFSLATGMASAFLMNRTPERAWIVVIASVCVWLFLFVLFSVSRVREDQAAPGSTRARAGRFALLLFSQVLTQQALLFPLPFYVRAAQAHPRHAVFFLAYTVAVVIALWDPLYERISRRPAAALAHSAFAAFVGLAMVLPILGFSNTTALVLAGMCASLALPLVTLASDAALSARRAVSVGARMAALVLLARGLAFLVPPAPLELLAIDIGTGVQDRVLVGGRPGHGDVIEGPSELFCHTTIKAPLGLKDALVHVWRRDGRNLITVPLDVRGGRNAGFRTWSRHSETPRVRAGRVLCQVETASGQVLGSTDVIVR